MEIDAFDGLPADYIQLVNDYELNSLEKKLESEKKNSTGWILIGISIFFLWPLMIVGIVMLINKSKTIKTIEEQINQRKNLLNTHNLRYSKVSEKAEILNS